MDLSTLFFLVQQMMAFTIPLLIVALGGLFSERSGVVNIALEGKMIIGGFAGILFVYYAQDVEGGGSAAFLSGQPLLLIALVIAALAGIVLSLPHAYASIHMKANQVISGTAINMFAPGFAVFVSRMIRNVQQIPFVSNQFYIEKVPVLGDIPFIGELFFQKAYITTYIGLLLLAASWIVLYKTPFGLRLRSCGEHPQAADSVGISVYKMRYIGVMISGAFAGIGGLVFVVATSSAFNASVAGYGFLALAVLIFGQWKPGRIFLAALFFGFMKTISVAYTSVSFLNALPVPGNIYKMMPFVATLIVLAFTSRNSQAPRASGQPYDKGGR